MLDKAGCLQRLNVRHSMSPTTPVIKVSPHNNQYSGCLSKLSDWTWINLEEVGELEYQLNCWGLVVLREVIVNNL